MYGPFATARNVAKTLELLRSYNIGMIAGTDIYEFIDHSNNNFPIVRLAVRRIRINEGAYLLTIIIGSVKVIQHLFKLSEPDAMKLLELNAL